MKAFARVVSPSMEKNMCLTTEMLRGRGWLNTIVCLWLSCNSAELTVIIVLSETVTTLRKQSLKSS